MNRSSFFFGHGVDADAWAKRYGITPFSKACECGREMRTTLPFVHGEFRGLSAPTCECGNEDTPYCLVRDPKHGDLFGTR